LITALYNITLHPLVKFPGPKSFGASQIPSTIALLTGNIGYVIKDLHDKYGPVVRTAPNELVFCSSGSLKDIYTRHGSRSSFKKDPGSYLKPPGGVHSILTVGDDSDHSRYRRLLAHAFSDKALQEQAPLLEKYVSLFISRLHSLSTEGPQNMVDWYNFIAFDIIGDLTLGESFDCLQESKSHPWVSYLMKVFKSSSFLAAARRYPFLTPVLLWFIPKEIIKGRTQHAQFTKEKVEKRMEMGSVRGDFMTYVLRHNDKEVCSSFLFWAFLVFTNGMLNTF
jgi:cytochrome P450